MNEVYTLPNKAINISSPRDKVPLNIYQINAHKKWEMGCKGKNVITAVLDTGCAINHPDLKDRIIGGFNFSDDSLGNINIYEDFNGHGTHVSGIIAGSSNGFGIVGVAPQSKILVVKVLNKYGTGSIENLVDGVHYAIDWEGPNGEKVDIISLSLGLKTTDDLLHESIKRAVHLGIPVVAASGNDGDGKRKTSEYRFPGSYPEPIVVGAIDKNRKIAVFSNTNEYVDLYAPGLSVYSSYLNEQYKILSGTSMAAPHVSGALALLIQEIRMKCNKNPSGVEIEKLLLKNTTLTDGIKVLDLSLELSKNEMCLNNST